MNVRRIALLALVAGVLLATSASGASLAVTNAAAVGDGVFGLECTIPLGPASNALLQDDSPNGESVYRVEFNFRPMPPGGNNAAGMPTPGTRYTVLRAKDVFGAEAFRVTFFRAWTTNDFFMFAFAFEDNGSASASFSNPALPVMFANNQTKIIFEYQTASAPGANDGSLVMYQGNTSNEKGRIENLDNDTRIVDLVDFGCFNQDSTDIDMALHLDAFASFRTLAP